MKDIYETLTDSASWASSFALLGGECDEFVRFLELEWYSFSSEYTEEQLRHFNHELELYKKYRSEPKRDWREDFSGRDFTELIV